MNILASSTRQWNPGDEFILMGIRSLFREAWPDKTCNWILYDRNPDLFQNGFAIPRHKEVIWGNSVCRGQATALDAAVVAGTPEWTGLPLEGFYRMVQEGCLPLALLGVGYVDAQINFTALEQECFARHLKLAAVRDDFAARALSGLGLKPVCLPCPALFAGQPREGGETGRWGFILQNHQVVNQSIPTEVMHACLHALKNLRAQGKSVDLVCNYASEFQEFARPFSPVRYSFEARDYLEILADYDAVISTRLHGAILANSLGLPSVLVQTGDTRLASTVSQFPYIDFVQPGSLLEFLKDYAPQPIRPKIRTWREQIKNRYLQLLRERNFLNFPGAEDLQ